MFRITNKKQEQRGQRGHTVNRCGHASPPHLIPPLMLKIPAPDATTEAYQTHDGD